MTFTRLILLFVTTLCSASYMTLEAQADTKKTENAAGKAKKTGKKSKQNAEAIDKNKKDEKLFNNVKSMYGEFSKLIADGVKKEKMKSFFYKYFDVPEITKSFVGSSKKDEKLIDAFIDYGVYLLKGEVISKVKDYSISDNFNQVNKAKTKTIQCSLKSDDQDSFDMSVVIVTKSEKIKDLIFMKRIALVGGAKNIFKTYCEENNLKPKKGKERSEIFQKAIKKQIAGGNK